MATLVSLNIGVQSIKIPDSYEEGIMGRDPECTIALDVDSISGKHCAVWLNDHRVCSIADLGSTNGVRVNGDYVTEYVMEHGDEVDIGDLKFEVEGPELVARAEVLTEAPEGETKSAPQKNKTTKLKKEKTAGFQALNLKLINSAILAIGFIVFAVLLFSVIRMVLT